MTDDPPASGQVSAADERTHVPGSEPFWGESWYFDWALPDGSLGGYVRLGLYPNLGWCWYWACVVGEGRELVTVVDHEVPLPREGSMEIRTEGLWADHTVEVPLDHLTLGCEAFAVRLDHPSAAYGAMLGERVPFGLDLEWDTDGGAVFGYPLGITRYEVACRVHGEVLVGPERIEVDGWGQRDHSWGVRDWWTLGWCWTAGRLDDGTRFHGVDVRLGADPVFSTGYERDGAGPLASVADVDCAARAVDEHGFPTVAAARIGRLDLAVEPVAFSPVLLQAPDGRVSHFPRALCRFTDRASGRAGIGWTEWNQPPGAQS